ncbi:MAG TPA: adenylyl-sulfate kinase [Candidatus Nitrosotalea sp.]|nr:adenylyl-sulfate kinase [Candidatus Nitrosotalea sp.]
MKATAIWLTGIPGSGKTTISNLLKDYFQKKNIPAIILDGDEIRKTISKDLGFSPEDRKEHNRRVIEIAKLLVKNNFTTIIPLISPYKETRDLARIEIPNFVEVYIKASLDVCIKRDPKGLYQKAKNGEITNLTGLQSPYEEPQNPELVLDTEKLTPQECLDIIMSYLEQKYL